MGAAVGAMDESSGLALGHGHVERGQHDLGLEVGSHRPADDLRLQTSRTTARKRNSAQVGTYVMSATQSLFGPSALNSLPTRSGAGFALASRIVVTQNRRRLTPAIQAVRRRRAMRLMLACRPSTSASSAPIRGAPYVPRNATFWSRCLPQGHRASSRDPERKNKTVGASREAGGFRVGRARQVTRRPPDRPRLRRRTFALTRVDHLPYIQTREPRSLCSAGTRSRPNWLPAGETERIELGSVVEFDPEACCRLPHCTTADGSYWFPGLRRELPGLATPVRDHEQVEE